MFIWVQKMILNLEGFFDVHHQTSNDGEKNHDGVDLIFAKSVFASLQVKCSFE